MPHNSYLYNMAKSRILVVLTLLIALSNFLPEQLDATPAHPKKEKHKFNEPAPAKGFYASAEWIGQYGGTRNYVDRRHFGIHFIGNLLNRNALHFNLGYLFTPHIYAGGGAGIEYQDRGFGDYTGDPKLVLYVGALWVVPVYAELRGYFFNKPTTPFLQLRMGYAPSIYAAEKRFASYNSSYNNFSIGVRINNHLSLSLGYLFMYQPAFLTGFDRTQNNSMIVDRVHQYQHYCTVAVVLHLKWKHGAVSPNTN